MTYDEFLEKHKPIQNHIDKNAGFDGMMFETYGKELDFVREQPSVNICTIIEGDDGELYVTEGYHLVNRFGYFVLSVPTEPFNIIID